jgi:hypothetical protein
VFSVADRAVRTQNAESPNIDLRSDVGLFLDDLGRGIQHRAAARNETVQIHQRRDLDEKMKKKKKKEGPSSPWAVRTFAVRE